MTRTLTVLARIVFALPFALVGCGATEPTTGAKLMPEVTMLASEIEGAPGGGETPGDGDNDPGSGDSAGKYGTLRGKITFTGSYTPLPFSGAVAAGDADVCKPELIGNDTFRVNVDAGNAVRDVFVWVKKSPKGRPALPESAGGPVELVYNNKNCRFEPHCMVVPIRTKVSVTNEDDTAHNTKMLGGNEFNATLKKGEVAILEYQKPVAVPIAAVCNFHAWMKGWQLVVRDPRDAAVTDENGEFELPDLPYGQHTIRVWHETFSRPKEYKIAIDAETVELNEAFSATEFQGVARRDALPTIVIGLAD